MTETSGLVKKIKAGDALALAKAISLIERREVPSDLMKLIHQKGRSSTRVIGLTGPPGAGKSTLVDKITALYRREKKTVGIVAIDPSSPFSGGALLGDRIRMQSHASDEGVFIRSLGSRGSHGGLSGATREVIRLYKVYGFDVILVETVGVGQTELGIMEIADTTLVVLTPESGDTVQTMKAGLLEIADIFVVNKSDRPGADRIKADLEIMVHMGAQNKEPLDIIMTDAVKGQGLGLLMDSLARKRPQKINKDEQGAREVEEIVMDRLQVWVRKEIHKRGTFLADPSEAALQILKKIKL